MLYASNFEGEVDTVYHRTRFGLGEYETRIVGLKGILRRSRTHEIVAIRKGVRIFTKYQIHIHFK